MKIIKSYFSFLLTFLVVDVIWIVSFAGGFYQEHLQGVLKSTPDYSLVGVFYLCYAAGVIYLVVKDAKSSKQVALAGAVFGALAYATFSITNYTLLDGWPMVVVVTDVLWGAAITATSALAGYFVYRH